VAHWLVKQEPTSYPYQKLERDGATEWDGVHNALALRHLRAMRPGDEALFYHSGDERQVVGILRVAGEPHPDPNDPRGSWSVRVEAVRPLERGVPLAELRELPGLDGLALLRISRLSVMPVSDEHWEIIVGRERTPAVPSSPRATAAPRTPGRRRRAAPAGHRSRRPTGSAAARRGSGKRRGRGTGG